MTIVLTASSRIDLPFTCTVASVPTAPTGTPTGVLVKNGTDLGTAVTVTMSGARGVAHCTIPSDAANGDRFYIRLSAEISGVTYEVPGPVETVRNTVVLPSVAPTDWLAADSVKADAVTKIQLGLATSTQVTALNNLSSLANLFGPATMEIPESGSTVYKFTLIVKDGEGKAVALDSSPTITVLNPSGTSRAGGLSAVSNPATGEYTFTYSVASTDTAEGLTFKATGAVSGEARSAFWVSTVVDYDALLTMAAIAALATDIKERTDNLPDSPAAVGDAMTLTGAYDSAKNAASQASVDAVKVDTGDIVTRITATLFSGITSLANWLGALAGKTADATTLTQINATTAGAAYDNTTDSLEAVRDNSGGGSSMTGAYAVTITVTDGTDPVPGALVRLKAGAGEDLKKTNGSGVAVFSADDNTYSVRITAEGLTFTPVSLVVTGDTSQTYAMAAVLVDDTTYATGEDLIIHADASTIGQMLRDDGVKVLAADVSTNAIVAEMLRVATGHVRSALHVSRRYTAEQLDALDDCGRAHLRWLTCAIAYWHLCQRRGNADMEKQGRNLQVIDGHLDRLRRGETVLTTEAEAAGIGEAVTLTQADMQRGTPLLRDRMSGTQGVFPNRRFNPRSGQ